jgi:hypothetical protein
VCNLSSVLAEEFLAEAHREAVALVMDAELAVHAPLVDVHRHLQHALQQRRVQPARLQSGFQ